MVQVIPNGTQKEKKVESPKDNSTVATGFVAKLDTFQPICGFSIVSSPVMGSGTISISPLVSISNVLFVPSLDCSPLSVSQLTKSHNCVFLFFPRYCTLKNIHMKEKIGNGKRSEELYYLKGNSQYTKGKALTHSVIDET